MLRTIRFRLLLLAFVALAGGCGFGDLVRLQRAVVREFDTQHVTVGIEGPHLTLTVGNAAFANLPEPARSEKAREIAEFARDHYGRYAELEGVKVAFGTREWGDSATQVTTAEAYTFTAAELGAPAAAR